MHWAMERNKNRAILQPEGTLCGLFSFGSDWHRSLPQEAAKVPCVEFFFPFSLCGESESGGIWQLHSLSAIVIPW